MNRLKKLNYHDERNRSSAIAIIDNKVFEGYTHSEAVESYFDSMNLKYDKNNKSYRDRIDYDVLEKEHLPYGFAHKINNRDLIFIEPETLTYMNIGECYNVLKQYYPNYDIYEDDETFDLDNDLTLFTKLGKLKKLNYHDNSNRDTAILFINGEIFEANTHSEALTNYLQDESDRYSRSEFDKKDSDELAFAHKCNNDNTIYIEQETLQNININTIATILKEQYPTYDIYADSEDIFSDNPRDYFKIAKLNNSKLKKLNLHDIDDRNCAIVFIDDKFYQGNTHAEALNNYLIDTKNIALNDSFARPYMPYLNTDNIDSINTSIEDKEDLHVIKDNIKQMAFAHLVEDENAIYIEETSLYNITLNTVAKLFKQEFPTYNIYNDDREDEDGNYIKIAKLKKLNYFDVSNRDSAILYINGKFIEAATHSIAMQQYLNLKETENLYYREDMYDKMKKGDQIIFAHKNDNIIYLEVEELYNLDLNTAINILKEKYPNYDIYEDDECINSNDPEDYIKLAKKLKK